MIQFFHDAVTVLSAKEWIAYILIVGTVFAFLWMLMEIEEREVRNEQRGQAVPPGGIERRRPQA